MLCHNYSHAPCEILGGEIIFQWVPMPYIHAWALCLRIHTLLSANEMFDQLQMALDGAFACKL